MRLAIDDVQILQTVRSNRTEELRDFLETITPEQNEELQTDFSDTCVYDYIQYPSRNFATTANSAAASLVGAIIPTQDKATVIGGVKVARGQRKGDQYIAAENDSFNSITAAKAAAQPRQVF